jgi:2-dehydropantoate 2-reductase
MNILIIGRGAIGSLYGWALAKVGHSVTYYVRPGRANQYGPTLKVDILDARTRMQGVRVRETFSTHLVEDLPANHNYDLIIVSVQHYRLPEVVDFLAHRMGNTTVLMFNNIWTDPHEEVAALPSDQLVWGFPRAGGGFGSDGVLTGGLLKNVMFGQFGTEPGTNPTRRDLAVRELFRSSGFGIQVQRDFRGWLWFHFLVNAGLLPQALKAGSFAQMVESDAHLQQAVLNVRELIPLLAARGVNLEHHAADLALFRIPPRLAALMLKLVFRLSAFARLIVESALPGDELRREVRPISRDVLLEARRLGISVPRLEALETFFTEEPSPPLALVGVTNL